MLPELLQVRPKRLTPLTAQFEIRTNDAEWWAVEAFWIFRPFNWRISRDSNFTDPQHRYAECQIGPWKGYVECERRALALEATA